jgi:hypothetical protein
MMARSGKGAFFLIKIYVFWIESSIPKNTKMKISKIALVVFASLTAIPFCMMNGCTKNGTTPPPVHDTVTVIKHDTTTITQKLDTPDLKTGLVLYLPFNGSFADSSGLNQTVTPLNGAALGSDMHGYTNSAFNSTGNGTVLKVTNNGSYAVDSAFSISFDFEISTNAVFNGGYDYSGLMTFVSIVDYNTAQGPTFNCGLNVPDSSQYFNFGVNGSAATCSDFGTNNPSRVGVMSNFIPEVGAWYNAICIYSHGTVYIYINGKLVGQKTGTGTSALFCPNASFIVGGWWNGTSGGASALENLRGKLDELRFYNRTLNAKQIAWLSRNFQRNSTKQDPTPQTGKGARLQ